MRDTARNVRFHKLVSWHVETFDEATNAQCLVCLSGKERYILGQALRQALWGTRWVSDVGSPMPDIGTVIAELEMKMNPDQCYDICEDVADCIETSGAVRSQIQQLIEQYSDDNGGNPFYNNPVPSDPIEDFTSNPTCDLDKLYAQAQRFVKFMHQNNEDFLELMELVTNPAERVDQVISAIPGVETLPIDEVFQVADATQELLKETYDASYTQGVEDDLVCDFFCFLKERCDTGGLSPEDIYQFWFSEFEEHVFGLGVFGSLNIILQTLLTGTYAGVEIVYLFMAMQVAYFKFLSQYIGVYTRRFATQLQLGVEYPSDDHLTLCDDCPTPELDWELLTGTNWGHPTAIKWQADSVPVGASHVIEWQIASGSPCGRLDILRTNAGWNQTGFIKKRRCGEGETNSQNTAQLTNECLEYLKLTSSTPFTMNWEFTETC